MIKAPPPRLTVTSIRTSQVSGDKNVEVIELESKSSPNKEEKIDKNKEKTIMETDQMIQVNTNQSPPLSSEIKK